ncbi:hypothetical protein BS614_30900 (plasmid) [Paenibacillus xylanexedens]|uniref:hypothetical protein n=1 Tax=Paenibacillus xylanexedens TaxID=528191 RepID=UPI0009384B8C|nr:hypothetical protein [Paenibacillus xylanexedens]APO48532.1 hypothetical protein BS614_30900 [Paenibacillus xylanexedens]
MFKAYRFIECGGKYFPPDPVETAAEIYQYVQTHKEHYPEIRVTDPSDELAVQAINGIIVFPKKWALLEVKQKYIDEPESFDSGAFKQALERSGFPTEFNIDFTVLAAQHYLTGLYEGTEGEE